MFAYCSNVMVPLSIRTGVKKLILCLVRILQSLFVRIGILKYQINLILQQLELNLILIRLSLGLYNIGLSHSYVEDDTACGYSIRLNQGQCGVEIEGYTIKWDKTSNLSQKTYTILDIKLLTIFLMHAVANSIQGANNYQLAPSYGYLEI